jgi:hypothetical protein
VLGLVVVGSVARFRDRGVRFWIVAALLFAVIALGPTLRFNGQEHDLPLPFDLLAALPFFKGNRYPSRYSVMLTLCWANLASYGLHRITSLRRGRAWRWGLPMVFSAAMLFEHLAVPLPLSDFRVPEVYATIAEQSGDFSVLELPLAWRNGFRVTGTKDPMIMFSQYYQTKHEKRLLGGNTSRNPEYKFQYFTEAPVINTIIALENGYEVEREVWDRDRELAPDVLRLLGVRYVVLHTDVVPAVVVDYVQYVFGGELVYERSGIIAYRLTLPPQGDTLLIDLGTDEASLHLGEGWSESGAEYVWAQRKETRLLVSLPGGAEEMSLRVLAPASGQSVEIIFNGHPVSSLELLEGWHDYEVQLPAPLVREGLNELHFRFVRLFPTGQIRDGLYAVGDTGVTSPVNILVKSAGEEVGDFGHIYVDGQDVSPGERGYNVVALDAVTGKVELIGHFDTFASEEESSRLADFIAGISAGKIVAVAVEDEASLHLTENAVEALRTIGAREDLRDMFRWEHAIIGVKGAKPGQALEATGLLRPVSVWVGQGFTEPATAAAMAEVEFTPVQ